jgi:hypothetical protein
MSTKGVLEQFLGCGCEGQRFLMHAKPQPRLCIRLLSAKIGAA